MKEKLLKFLLEKTEVSTDVIDLGILEYMHLSDNFLYYREAGKEAISYTTKNSSGFGTYRRVAIGGDIIWARDWEQAKKHYNNIIKIYGLNTYNI